MLKDETVSYFNTFIGKSLSQWQIRTWDVLNMGRAVQNTQWYPKKREKFRCVNSPKNETHSTINSKYKYTHFLYSLTICLLHYYPRHVSSINMLIFRRKNCIHTASGIFAVYKRLDSTLVESGLRSQPLYCADVYRERRYQMLCEYNFSSWRWAC